MKTISLFTLFIFSSAFLFGQTIFYTEDFGTGCNTGQLAENYVSMSGGWTPVLTGVNETFANVWYVGAAENNTGEGNCSEGCGTNGTLHLGSTALGDIGAAYYDGSSFCSLIDFCGATAVRAESSFIDCTDFTDITLDFLFIEGGNTQDNGSVWYFDGSNWSLLDDTPKTFSGTCSPQGVWTSRSIALPESANNNPNVKIGFEWVNNDDGVATDPSYAIDDIALSGMEAMEEPCIGDLNNDGFINAADLLIMIADFTCLEECIADFNGDGITNVADLLIFLEVFGSECPE